MNAQRDDGRSAMFRTAEPSGYGRIWPDSGGLFGVLDSLVTSIEEVAGDGVIGSVLVLDDAGERLRNGAAPHLPVEYCNAIDGMRIGPKAGSCGTAAFRRERVIESDIARDPLWDDYRTLAQRHGLASCWSTPILGRDGRVLGTFTMYYPYARGPRADELTLVDVFARTAAAAIDRAQDEVTRERAVREAGAARAEAEAIRADLQWLLDAIGTLNSQLSYDDGFEYLARRSVRRLADIAIVDIFQRGRAVQSLAVCDEPQLADVLLRGRDLLTAFVNPEVAGTRFDRPEIRSIDMSSLAYRHVDPELLRVLRGIDAREMMVVPLIARKELLGVLSLLVRGERRCTQHSLALATGLAWRAALVIDNSRLLAVRQQSVSDLQHGLLPPRLPAVAGVDVGGHYQPVAPDLLVGGDFYDFFAVGGGWGFMIGDICGKGASAARMTGLVRHTARALAAAGVDQFGPDRLAATAVALAGDSSAAIAMGLTEAVLRFAAAEIADDIAVLVLTPRDGVPGAGRGVLADGISA